MKTSTTLILFSLLASLASALVVPLPAATPAESLQGCSLSRLADGESIDLGKALSATKSGKTMLVLGTHTADFNMIEYGQRVRAALPELKERGIDRFIMVMNGSSQACQKLVQLIDLPEEIEVFADPTGEAGRRFGVNRGFRPDDDGIPVGLKVTVVGLGFGPPWGTLPAVLTGYFGNPNGRREWIEESLKQGQLAGRWPEVLELGQDGKIVGNKFDNFPLLSGWGRRPFELATLRLQNIVDIQMKHWGDLKPVDDRCLTQLGGCTIVESDGKAVYSWVDQGLCDVPDMNQVVKLL
jgi:hypothetical protein